MDRLLEWLGDMGWVGLVITSVGIALALGGLLVILDALTKSVC